MNLRHLNLDLFGIPEDAEIQLPVFLIAADLKTRKLTNALADIGSDGSFCIPELCDLVLAYVGFDDRPNELYDFYFELLDRECDNVSDKNNTPIKEAYKIYNELLIEKGKHMG